MERLAIRQLSSPLLTQLGKSWVSLMTGPTPVTAMSKLNRVFDHEKLFIKREDLTAPIYGGNKIRNLEFILSYAKSQGFNRLTTAAPLGSNFTAALSAQATRVGMQTDIFHFVPQVSPQIKRHAAFTRQHATSMTILNGPAYFSAARAFLKAQSTRIDHSFLVAPGGSSPIGVLGHLNAALELAEQIKRREIPEPDYLIVGAGTCGTVAGLISGLKIAGLSTRVIGGSLCGSHNL